jgi:C-terminal processing protease CtpA/Prc
LSLSSLTAVGPCVLLFLLPAQAGAAPGHTGNEAQAVPSPATLARGWLGIGFDYVEAEEAGARVGRLVVLGVAPKSPARTAGVLAGDVIVALEGKSFIFANRQAALERFASIRPGDTVRLTVLRGHSKLEMAVVAAPMTAEQAAAIQRSYVAADKADKERPSPR